MVVRTFRIEVIINGVKSHVYKLKYSKIVSLSLLFANNMRFFYSIITFLLLTTTVLGQKKLERTLKQLNSESVPYVYVNELKQTAHAVLLDTRKQVEYNVSHLKDAIWVGYKTFSEDSITAKITDKNTPIVVYCSIGVRSEDIGEKLQKAGYTNVKNLYGGIFEWKNQGNLVYKNNTTETDSVHTFNKHWGKLLTQGIKVYDTKQSN
jgi:rhodanese-related sulfurtransferase